MYDFGYVRNLFVLEFDGELLCNIVGEFDVLPDEVFDANDDENGGDIRDVPFTEFC